MLSKPALSTIFFSLWNEYTWDWSPVTECKQIVSLIVYLHTIRSQIVGIYIYIYIYIKGFIILVWHKSNYPTSQLIIYYHYTSLLTRISLTFSRHPSLSSIASRWSSRQHSVSVQRCCRYVRVSRPIHKRPCEGVHKRTSLTSASLLLQQWPACSVRLIWIVFKIGGRWPYICSFVLCCFQDCFTIARWILVQL